MRTYTGGAMKRMMIACALMIAAFSGRDAAAQGHERPDRPEMRERIERVERLKQMRLIEELQLGEEEAVRFMAKRKEHEDRLKGLADERNSFLDELGAKLGPPADARQDGKSGGKSEGKSGGKTDVKPDAKPDLQAVDRVIALILEQDRKIFEERKRYQDEMRKMLSTDRFAKMLLFERDFQMQVRDAMGRGRSMNNRPQKFDE
jgi:hypothetical protein